MSEYPPNTSGNPAKIQRNLTIAQDRLAGMTFREIAKKHDITYPHVSYILSSDKEISKMIEAGTKEQVSMIPKSNEVLLSLFDSEVDTVKLGAVKHHHELMGMTGKHTAPVLQQFIQVNNINTIDKALTTAYNSAFGEFDEAEEAEIED